MTRSSLIFLTLAGICLHEQAEAFSSPATKIAGRQHVVSPLSMTAMEEEPLDDTDATISRRSVLAATVATTTAAILTSSLPAEARLESVNRPDLLPKESGLNVIQVEKFLTSGQAKRMNDLLTSLEKSTGWRVRVLCQNYPNTPGLAIRDYWDLGKEGQKDDKYVVLVVDQFGGRGNVLNFNVGDGVKFALPNIFWTRLQAKYGTTFYVRDNGIDLAIINAIEAVVSCLKSGEDGYCVNVPDEGQSMRGLGLS